MPLYQNSVLKKYLKQQDSKAVVKAFKKFTKYFRDPKIQENIRSSKEEEYQGVFLTELFSKILGYTMKPNADFNLVAEYKNEKNNRKADGAILKDNEAIGVIELKGTNTKDLEKVRQQAFDYKANQTGCIYVITSNFEKIRFYINNAVDFEEFDLFNINQERFELLYLCLAKDNLLSNVPLKIKEASVQEEEAITKQFYKDYSTFKRELFRDLVKQNMKNEVYRSELNIEDAVRANKNIKHNLFKKSQTLIDRFLFIFFAEDRGLLPPNSTVKILEQWNKLKELDEVVPLYSRYKKYFNYLDTGRKGSDKTAEIFAYNGGLFKPDAVLDSLIISDELLAKHTNALQAYDFESQVDVNILGHIFENSLNEIESVNAEIEGTDFDKQKTKRKKDGVYYTPKYITKYIVDNTVGKLCNEKKAELGVIEDEYLKSRKGRSKAKLKELLEGLEAYREWLLQITILDPACGSGAFLNQALDFLIKEHQYIDELQTNLLGGGFVFPDIENTVLENNIFGVDINEESVEIAKLSLWLRTAQPRRKLNNLTSNIKCGNSLIDSKSIAGDKAFKWEEEFPKIFEKNGFDVIIGNPPYVPLEELVKEDRDYIRNKFPQFSRKYDTSVVFKLHSINILKENGYLSFVTTITWQTGGNYTELRKFIFENVNLEKIINLPFNVFADAYVDTGIFVLKKSPFDKKYEVLNFDKKQTISTLDTLNFVQVTEEMYDEESWKIVLNPLAQKILKRNLKSKDKVLFGDITSSTQGLSPSRFEIEEKLNEKLFPFLLKGQVYQYQFQVEEIGYTNMDDKENLKKFYGAIPKILFRRLINRQDRLTVGYNDVKCVFKKDINPFIVKSEDIDAKFLLAIMASKLISYLYVNTSSIATKDDFRQTTLSELRQVPIILPIKSIQDKFVVCANTMLILNKTFHETGYSFYRFLMKTLDISSLGNKLESWHELEFGDFIKELNKAIKKAGGEKLSKMDEMDWMEVFETKKAEAQTLKAEINKTDKEIDSMVYELYELTDEEIQMVENN